ncbi:hypothetical protein [Siphonobacter aquaeclarae]|uniref:Adhesin domain-containing protein n=1 Tax=Siphonobacter aquaeclarae TaxID=563176 RepID=A0A1G9NC42_9BACT|nr:hypothetical protein [Siphonobacter aquaeclarae]SDL83999.1 hypothetical protein SAMN04488090_1946 [Siphonobacter aquaeclarae]
MKRLFSGVWLALLLTAPAWASDVSGTLAERKRTIVKSFSVSGKDNLYLSNQHGDVRIHIWDKNEVRAEILIQGFGKDDEEAQKFIDAVEIDESRNGNQIRLETRYNEPKGNWNWKNLGWGRSEESKTRGVRISYSVNMPKYVALELQNRFANAQLADFSAPLRVNTQYGNFVADRLMSTDNDIRVEYGNATIKELNEGNLKIQYSKLDLEKADRLRLINNYGSLLVNEVGDLDATIQYSKGKIGKLKEQARLNINYSDNVQLPVLMRTVRKVDVRSNYTSVRLPVGDSQDMDFDVTVSYANFGYPNNLPIAFDVKDDGSGEDGKHRYVPKMTKTYKGKVGKGGCTVRIVSNYGAVKFVD